MPEPTSVGLHDWSVRVSSEEARSTVHTRGVRFEIGSPAGFDAAEPRASALEHLLGAIGADLTGGFRALARRRRLDLDRLEALVECRLENPLVHLGVVGERGSPRIEKVAVKVYVGSLASRSEVLPVWEEALARSPLAATLRALLDVQVEVAP